MRVFVIGAAVRAALLLLSGCASWPKCDPTVFPTFGKCIEEYPYGYPEDAEAL